MRNALSLKHSSFLLAAAVALSIGVSQAHATVIFNTNGTNLGGAGGSSGGFFNGASGDDGTISSSLGFTFSYYNTNYTTLGISYNGYVFTPAGTPSAAYGPLSNSINKPVIAAYWNDNIVKTILSESKPALGYIRGQNSTVNGTTYANSYSFSYQGYDYNDGGYANDNDVTKAKFVTFQISVFGGATNTTVTLADSSTFTFQPGDIALSYDKVSNSATGNVGAGITNGAGTSTFLPGAASGSLVHNSPLFVTAAGSFILFRPNVGQTAYTSSVQSFASASAFADVTVTPSSGARTATAGSNTIDITATAGTYDITGVTLTGAGFSVSNIANATGTTGNKNGAVSFASAGKLNGDYAGTYGFSIANANSGNGAYSYTLSTTVTGNTGNQSATIAAGTDLGNLTNKLSGTSDKSLGSVATLLDGTLSGDSTISMSWRNRAANEIYPGTGGPFLTTPAGLYSDVLDLSGIAPGDIFVLQMSYGEAAFTAAGLDEAGASLGFLDSVWKNAIAGNTAGPLNLAKEFGAFVDLGTPGLSDDLGRWGVDTTNNVVWAVINHNSEFAVIPEPASLGLLSIGALALLARRRK